MHMATTDGTPTTLGQLTPGDEILTITSTKGVIPAHRVTTGVRYPATGRQRLIVHTANVHSRHAMITFTNGGRLLPVAATTPCTIA